MRVRAAALLAASLPALAGTLSACGSSQSKNEQLAKENKATLNEKGLKIKQASKDVRVLNTTVLEDENGSAAVVTMKSSAKQPLLGVPVAINVLGKKGKSVYRNNAPGLEPSLIGPSIVEPGKPFVWINDQLDPSGPARKLKARIGEARQTVSGPLPKIELSATKLKLDETSGLYVSGKATNKSKVLQSKLVVYGLAYNGTKVVAAGRGQLDKLRPGKTRNFEIYVIGNPKGARLAVAAPPTSLK